MNEQVLYLHKMGIIIESVVHEVLFKLNDGPCCPKRTAFLPIHLIALHIMRQTSLHGLCYRLPILKMILSTTDRE